jgi:hypothetical protein
MTLQEILEHLTDQVKRQEIDIIAAKAVGVSRLAEHKITASVDESLVSLFNKIARIGENAGSRWIDTISIKEFVQPINHDEAYDGSRVDKKISQLEIIKFTDFAYATNGKGGQSGAGKSCASIKDSVRHIGLESIDLSLVHQESQI